MRKIKGGMEIEMEKDKRLKGFLNLLLIKYIFFKYFN